MRTDGEKPGAGRRRGAAAPQEQRTALVCAADLLARQEQSRRRLHDKLRRRGYGEEETAAALDRLEERHYLDDEELCRRQFRFLYESSRNSVRQIMAKLMTRGFSRELVEACVPEDASARDQAAAAKQLRVKFRPEADRRKMMASLCRAGFSPDDARIAVEGFAADGMDED